MKPKAKPTMVNTTMGMGLYGGKADRGEPFPQEKGAEKATARAREHKFENALAPARPKR